MPAWGWIALVAALAAPGLIYAGSLAIALTGVKIPRTPPRPRPTTEDRP